MTGAMMTWSVREARMIVERILLAAGIPDGFVPAVRDAVVYAQAMGLNGLEILRALSRPRRPATCEAGTSEVGR